MSFAEIVKAFVERKDENRVRLAVEFEVGPGTVDRWCRGIANPHPLLKQQIIKWIATIEGTIR